MTQPVAQRLHAFRAKAIDAEIEKVEKHHARLGHPRGERLALTLRDQGEPDTVLYRVFMREDAHLLTFIEGYTQSGAMLFHDKRFITHFADDIAALTVGGRLCVYGDVSDAYRAFAAENGFEVEYFNSLSGFQR